MRTKNTVRVLLLNPANQALMIKVSGGNLVDTSKPLRKAFWITPGGSIEENEAPEQAVIREIWEETGIQAQEPEKIFGYGEQILEWKGMSTLLREKFYCIRVPYSEVRANSLTEEEKVEFNEYRWWGADEMRKSGEIFLPACMPDLIEELSNETPCDGVRIIDLSTPDT